jgi:hypothetical protein
MNSYIFSFKKMPFALIISIALVILIEFFVFSKAYLVSDLFTLVLATKRAEIKKGINADVLIIGDSRSAAINPKYLESKSDKYKVYNLSIPHMGSSHQYYLTLQQYLRYNKEPKLILFSAKPFILFGKANYNNLFSGQAEYRIKRLHRFLDSSVLLKEFIKITFKNIDYRNGVTKTIIAKLEALSYFFKNLISGLMPSFDYREFVKYVGPNFITKISQEKNVNGLIHRNLNIVIEENLKRRNSLIEDKGQVLFNSHGKIDEKQYRDLNIQFKNYLKGANDLRALESFVEFTNKLRIPVIFFVMPQLDAEVKLMNKYSNFYDFYQKLRLLGKNFNYFYFYDDFEKSYEDKYFGDWSHLNQLGVLKMNTELSKTLKPIIISAINKIPN